jgi:hypothetical protein
MAEGMAENRQVMKSEYVSRCSRRGHGEARGVKEVQPFELTAIRRCRNDIRGQLPERCFEYAPFRSLPVEIEKNNLVDATRIDQRVNQLPGVSRNPAATVDHPTGVDPKPQSSALPSPD